MSDSDHEALLSDALALLKEAQERLDAMNRERREPLAIVGMGLRLPGGVDSPEDLWDGLLVGRDLTSDIPANRWDKEALFDPDRGVPGTMATRRGGYIEDPHHFDAAFFGISPREAPHVDPQQRLLLETAWRALEHAAIAPSSLRGRPAGVFVGISTFDYASHMVEHLPRDQVVASQGTGIAHAAAAGRIAYLLGLTGPAMVLNTACSSSLLAVHLAAESLRRRECDHALVGGVNLLLHPASSIVFSQAHMLAPDGRCKTFSARADGYGRAEGAAMVVMKRLSDAERDGDRILAEVLGSAVNQDGASGGFTVPNGPMQEAVIRRALERAGLSPGDVDGVEAHGTGTPLGDPLEVGALARVFAASHGKDSPLRIASIKANLGHLEAAAGIAGVLRMVLQLQHGEWAPHLRFGDLSPHIPWERLPVDVPLRREPWIRRGRPRVGGVSSFGFTGTNVHVVLRESASPRPEAASRRRASEVSVPVPVPGSVSASVPFPVVVPLSAQTEPALLTLLDAWIQHVERDDAPTVQDLAYTAARGRSPFRHRVAVVARDREGLLRELRRAREGGVGRDVWTGHASPRLASRVAVTVGTWPRDPATMAERLGRTWASMADHIRACGEAARPAVQTALLAWWRRVLGPPAITAGEGPGAAVAAWARDAVSLEDALRGGALPPPQEIRGELHAVLDLGGRGPPALKGLLRIAAPGEEDPAQDLMRGVAAAWVAGLAVDWSGAHAGLDLHVVDVPHHPWRRLPYTIQRNPSVQHPEWERGHPLLGTRHGIPGEDASVFPVFLRPDTPAYLGGWRPGGRAHLPPGVIVEMIVGAAQRVLGTSTVEVVDLEILHVPLLDARHEVVVVARPEPSRAGIAIVVDARPRGGSWQRLGEARARVALAEDACEDAPRLAAGGSSDSDSDPGSDADAGNPSAGDHAADRSLQRDPDWILALASSLEGDRVILSGELGSAWDPECRSYAIHPILFDVLTQAVSRCLEGDARARRGARVARIGHLLVRGRAGPRLTAAATPGGDAEGAGVVLWGSDGSLVARARGVMLSSIDAEVSESRARVAASRVHTVVFEPMDGARPLPPAGRWLVLGEGAFAARVTRALAASSADVVIDATGPARGLDGEDDAAEVEGWIAGVLERGAARGGFDGVVFPGALEGPLEGPVDVLTGRVHARFLAVAQALVRGLLGVRPGVRLVVLTRGAVTVGGDTGVVDPLGRSLIGAARVLAAEHPELRVLCIDLDPDADPEGHGAAAELLPSCLDGDGEEERVIRRGQILVPRVRPCADVGAALPFPFAGRWLITGGCGAVGLHLAAGLVARGVRHVTLVSRGGEASADPDRLAEVRASGAAVDVRAVDVTDAAAVVALVDALRSSSPPLLGIIHGAGVLDDALIMNLDGERLARVLAPKVKGAWNLHRATAGMHLDAFVLLSSAAGLLGSPGQGPYAAANAFLDGLAEARASMGLVGCSVAFGPWAGEGMAGRTPGAAVRFAAAGVQPLDPGIAFLALEVLLVRGLSHGLVLDVDWTHAARRLTDRPVPSPLRALVRPPECAAAPEGALPLRARLDALPAEARGALLADHVRLGLATVLRQSPDDVDPDRSFVELGLDSLMGLELRNRVQAELGVAVPMARLLAGGTLAEVIALVLDLYEEARRATAGAVTAEEEAALLQDIEGLSEEEVRRLLSSDDEDG